MIVVLYDPCSGCVQNNLPAHSVPSVEKAAHRDVLTRLQPGQHHRYLSHRHRAHLALDLALEARLVLMGAVLQLEVQERDPGRRVAERLDLGEFTVEFDRVHIR
jgi:hypothetical protein